MEKLKTYNEAFKYEPDVRLVYGVLHKTINDLITDSEAKDERIARLEKAVRNLAIGIDGLINNKTGNLAGELMTERITEILTK